MQDLYADVIVDISTEELDRVFQYRIPESMRDSLEPGTVVKIPFGRGSRMIRGYVTGISTDTDYDPDKIKEIAGVVTDAADAEARLVSLAAWMKQKYGSTMIQALRTVLPIKKKVRPRVRKTLVLTADRDTAGQQLELFRKKHYTARARLLEALLEEGEIPWELAADKLNITGPVAGALEQMGLTAVRTERVPRAPVPERSPAGPGPQLNPAQRKAADKIIGEWDSKPCGRYLIQGVTGSGKTEVYMELIGEAVRRGRQAIVLIPEIALTYQTLIRFYRRFGDRVSVINSRLSAGERYDQFCRARKGELDVMIGPRSALFTPFPALGIIVIDEEQEPAYQSETMPRYHAREVACRRGEMEGARVVLGSATPSLEARYGAEKGYYELLELPERANQAALPQVTIVDLREELRSGNRSILSRELRNRMEDCLAAGKQIMLFLNRRGYAGFLNCRSCGHVIRCPHCDVSLTLHSNGRLICHYCGYEQPNVTRCPSCGSGFLRVLKAGTQQIEEEVKRRFPKARVLRMDLDSTRGKEGHARILSAFAEHEADILIGTQMIVKGHDFPEVTLMGILAADLSLYVPDYRAAERTFQLLTQAAGRAGRGQDPGSVVIQTYDPDHYSIRAAARQDYEAFYEEEMDFRRLGNYPPVGRLAAIHCSCPDPELLDKACGHLKNFIEEHFEKYRLTVLGPADEAIARIQDIYRKVIYLKHTEDKVITAAIGLAGRYTEINEGFRTVSIQYEVN